MNEDYNFLKLELCFLKALKEAREDTGDGLFYIDNFTLFEKFNIPLDDIKPLLEKTENQGVLKIISKNNESNEFVEYLIQHYIVQFDDEKLKKQIVDINDKITGKVQIRFDNSSSTLYLDDIKVDFNLRNAGSNQKDLCRLLLKDKESINREWSCDEVLESWGWKADRIYNKDGQFLNKNRTIVYRAARDLNSRIMNLTDGKVKELFAFDTKEVSINKKYRDCIKF